MSKVVTPTEMAAMDRMTIENGIEDYELMEKAGSRCAEIIAGENEKDKKVLSICGAGNNGGDGQVIARCLFNAGYIVRVLFTGAEEKMTPSSRKNLRRLESVGVPYSFYQEMNDDIRLEIESADIIVDAVLGNGIKNRPLYPRIATLFDAVNAADNKIYAVDIPSGLRGDVGKSVGSAVIADRTLLIQNYKTGCLLNDGPDTCGNVTVVDVGILEKYTDSKKYLLDENSVPELPPRKKQSHKYTYGAVSVIAGAPGMVGAGLMASTAALRSGAGLVTTFADESVWELMAAKMPWEIMVKSWSEDNLISKLRDQRTSVYLFGPGVGRNTDFALLLDFLMNQDAPVVIDADGLFALSQHLDLLKGHRCPLVVTPHMGEFSRLCGQSKEEIEENILDIGQSFAAEYNLVLVLKGHHTLIFEPDGTTAFNMSGNPGMATAGSGDVLAGMAAGLIPQMKNPADAAKRAVFCHGAAGDFCAQKTGEAAMTAVDMLNCLGSPALKGI